MQNRFLLAMLLSLVVLSIYGSMMEPPKKEAEGDQKAGASQEVDGNKPGNSASVDPASDNAPTGGDGDNTGKLPTDTLDEGSPFAGELFLQSDKVRFEFDQRGAALSSAFLLDQFATVEDKKRKSELAKGSKDGRLEFIRVYEGGERAFDLYDNTRDGEAAAWANKALWKTDGPSADGKSVTFRLPVVQGGESFVLTKTFKLNGSGRRMDVDLSLEATGGTSVTKNFWMNTSGGVFPADRAYLLPNDPQAYGHSVFGQKGPEGEIQSIKVDDVLSAEGRSKTASSALYTCDMGVYFGAYLWPKGDAPVKDLRFRATDTIADLNIDKVTPQDLERYGPMRIWSQVGVLLNSTKKGSPHVASFDYYVGPKDHRVIKESFADDTAMRRAYLAVADAELTSQSIFCCSTGPLGWLIQSVSKAVVWLLSFFTELIGSAGVAIILLTICVRMIMFPITRKSQTAMHIHGKKMAKLKPQIEVLKEKYKNDPQKMQKAQMALFKENDTKLLPLGGCLPMFLQIPIFFGLFSAIRFDYDLRHAGFLWCEDLSMPDRLIAWEPFNLPCFCGPGLVIAGLNVLPLLMIAAMFFHQMGMPKSPDPQMQQQQKMMMFMPLMFGLFMYAYAAGLSVYWLSSSLFGIFEQRVIKKMFPIDKGDDAAAGAPQKA